MPRIDPLSLLKCLSVLLGPNGGIKSKEEVTRLANLMTKFSKKLVSKCIYIQILKNTESVLLDQFMGHGGWNLIHMWLTDGILAKNWALIQELLELLLLCPVDTNRLKSNHCPKLIKGLSKEGSHQGVRTLASRLVEQWLRMVKGEATPHTNAIQAATISSTVSNSPSSVQSVQTNASINPVTSQSINSENAATLHASDSPVVQNTSATHSFQELLKNVPPPKTSQLNNVQTTVSSVYKITIRDGKQVLTQVQTDAANINNVMCVSTLKSDINGGVDQVLPKEDDSSKFAIESEQAIQRTSGIDKSDVDDLLSEEKDKSTSLRDETDNVKSKDSKNEKDVGSDGSKSTSDKENRDKKDDKKSSSGADKKSSSHSQSSSRSSSKHSSSSSKHSSSSSKHSSSSHRSSSKSSSSSSSRDKSSRDKEKDRHHSSSSKSSSSKSKTERDKDKEREREKQKKDQAEKDKAALEKVQGQILSSKIGKIPKKKSDEEKSEDSSKKSSTDSKDGKEKKLAAVPEKKKISISIENRKNSQDSTSRPKTVKTFNSKFRSTGLEEEVKPPPPRGSKKQTSLPEKKIIPPPKLPLKRSSPIKETGPLDKKAKLAMDLPPIEEKKGGIKLIPAKPKLVFLQESDMFMDALTASTRSKEPRKRRRRPSLTKDGPPDLKKLETAQENHRDASSPPTSPTSPSHSANNKDASDKPVAVEKPTFKFYQDTLETDEEKEDKAKSKVDDDSAKDAEMETDDVKKSKKESKAGDDDERDRSRTPTPENDFYDEKSSDSPEDPAAAVSEALSKEEQTTLESRPIGVLKSVLLLQKRKGPKKSLKWKTDLESIRYFELDETERVNVTKTSFTDMKQMEKMNEREAFQMARKLSSEDVMEEKTLWKPLIPIDTDPPLVEPGKDSREKDIQYAREKGILQALYFHRGMIPDSSAEPDEERHHIYIEPKIIPLDDLTGNKESEKDYSNMPWPEPKPQPAITSTSVPSPFFQTFRGNQPPVIPPVGVQPPMNSMPPQMMNPMAPQMPPEMAGNLPPVSGGGGGWRTGDGKIVVPDPSITPMPNMNATFPQGMDVPPMAPPNMMGPPMFNPDGYAMPPEDMNFNNFQGPPGPNMFGPGPGGPPSGGPPGPPFQGPRGPPMHGNRGRGGPGWFRGGPPRGMPWRGGWRGNGKQPPVCRQFKAGFCRVGDKCQFLHPGQNCPPF